jgi:hypothetical protein
MDKLPCDIIVEFFDRRGKFVWATDEETHKDKPIDNLIEECNQVYKIYGDGLTWEMCKMVIERGKGREELQEKIKSLLNETEKNNGRQ